MASNDSGVETSNDSNDSSFVFPLYVDLRSAFENDGRPREFALPEPLPLPADGAKHFPSGSHSLKMMHTGSYRRVKCKFINALTESRERRLRMAASTCNTELLTKLLDGGTNPNCYDEHKRSPLHLAACRGFTDIVSQLLNYGANPNIVDSLGNTPLHLAVISASSNNFNLVVRILLRGGASVHIRDKNGKNPLDLARSKLGLLRSRYCGPSAESSTIVEDMCVLIAVILQYFCKQQQDLNELNALERRLQNLTTRDEVASEADALLASVERLSLTQ